MMNPQSINGLVWKNYITIKTLVLLLKKLTLLLITKEKMIRCQKYIKILFDLDNTLVDDDENRKYAFRKILEGKNCKATEDEANAFITLDNKFWRDRAAGKIKDPYTFKNNQEKSDWVQSQDLLCILRILLLRKLKVSIENI